MLEKTPEVVSTSALATLGPHDHPCLIYDTPDEQADAFVPYLYAGLLRGELCVYVVDETHPEFILAAFRQRNVDIDPYVKKGAFKIITKHDAYLTEGFFDIPKMMQFWKNTVDDALASGYSAVRAAAEMTW
jgi:KaiC/GvpD/RAD55 family RecA-like ATPase